MHNLIQHMWHDFFRAWAQNALVSTTNINKCSIYVSFFWWAVLSFLHPMVSMIIQLDKEIQICHITIKIIPIHMISYPNHTHHIMKPTFSILRFSTWSRWISRSWGLQLAGVAQRLAVHVPRPGIERCFYQGSTGDPKQYHLTLRNHWWTCLIMFAGLHDLHCEGISTGCLRPAAILRYHGYWLPWLISSFWFMDALVSMGVWPLPDAHAFRVYAVYAFEEQWWPFQE